MAQFDTIIIFPIIWSLILVLIVNYFLIIKIILPRFIGLLKFRNKLIKSSKPAILNLKFLSL
jgi:hypothetical protein